MKKIFIHTKTQKEFNKVMEIFRKKGIVDAYQQEVWDNFKEDTLVRYGTPIIIHSINHAKGEKIISFKKFLYLEAMKQFEQRDPELNSGGQEKKEPSHSLGWTPKEWENYWYIIDNSVIYNCKTYSDVDFQRINEGNCYKTEAEAKKVLDKRRALRRIHEYMRENDLFFDDVDWEDAGQEKYVIYGWDYASSRTIYGLDLRVNLSQGDLFFRTRKDRRKVLDNCAEDLEIFLKD